MAKGLSRVAGGDYYNETISPTPAFAPKMIAAVAKEKGLSVYHLDVFQVFAQAPLREEACLELSGNPHLLAR